MAGKTKKVSKPQAGNTYSIQFTEFIGKNNDRIKVQAEKFADFKINAVRIGFDDARNRVINWIGNFDKISFTNFELPLKILESFEFIKAFVDICPRLSLHATAKKIFDSPDSYLDRTRYPLLKTALIVKSFWEN